MALKEKNRYFAQRIAQTELARAHQAEVARDLMADAEVTVVQVLMNPMHPKTDICDLHASSDLWGLGPGCYPKAQAPQPVYHPFCLCKLRARRSLSVDDARRVPGGEAAYLRSLGSLSQAGAVMGSRARAEAVLNGAPVDRVINAGKDPQYRLRRLGDPGTGHVLVPAESASMRTFRQPAETFGPYDPGAPRAAPDISTPARAAAARIEDLIRRDTVETGVFIAADGRELLRRQGAPDRVRYFEDELAVMQGATFTHNHPGGSPFSPEDLALAAGFGLAELRVVTADFRHVAAGLSGIDADWPVMLAERESRAAQMLHDEVRSGILHPLDFGLEVRHRALSDLAKALGFTYMRERS